MTRQISGHRPPVVLRDPHAAPHPSKQCGTCMASIAPEHVSRPEYHSAACTAYPRPPAGDGPAAGEPQ